MRALRKEATALILNTGMNSHKKAQEAQKKGLAQSRSLHVWYL
jgi:hypothetical protein